MRQPSALMGLVVASLIWATPLRAEIVEVAKDVRVTKKSFVAPSNEQPFFGFAEKTPAQQAIDEKFVNDLIQAAGSRQKAFNATMQRGWLLVSKGDLPDAAKRFNQAYLLGPEQSAIYHGFAVIAAGRFNDVDFAEELFKTAQTRPAPLKALLADYGRFLLMAKRPRDAQAVLERSVAEAPDFADAWSNLALARVQNGDPKAACAAAEQAGKLRPSPNVMGDLNIVRRQASCG